MEVQLTASRSITRTSPLLAGPSRRALVGLGLGGVLGVAAADLAAGKKRRKRKKKKKCTQVDPCPQELCVICLENDVGVACGYIAEGPDIGSRAEEFCKQFVPPPVIVSIALPAGEGAVGRCSPSNECVIVRCPLI
jgi:hypothetical protein